MSKKKIFATNFLYLFLPIALILIWLIFIYKYDPKLLFNLMVLALGLYFILSILHHYFDKSLNFETIIEYILLGTLAAIIALGVQLL